MQVTKLKHFGSYQKQSFMVLQKGVLWFDESLKDFDITELKFSMLTWILTCQDFALLIGLFFMFLLFLATMDREQT